MLYFIPWVLLMLVCILAVPIASMMDKRKLQASYEGYESGEAAAEDDELEPLEPLEDEAGGDVLAEGSIQEEEQNADDPFGTGASEDFPEFDEEFK